MLNIKLDKSARGRAIADRTLREMERERLRGCDELGEYKEKVKGLLGLLEEGYEDNIIKSYASGDECCEVYFKNRWYCNGRNIDYITKSIYFNEVFPIEIRGIQGINIEYDLDYSGYSQINQYEIEFSQQKFVGIIFYFK